MAKSEFIGGGRTTKIDRYKWTSSWTRGEFRLVPKLEVNVDHDYQRNVSENKARAIAAALSWPAFGVLILAQRADGTLWIVDGQHRLFGALARADITDVPCMVYQSSGCVEEAGGFLAVNTLRRNITAVEKHAAMTTSGDPNAEHAHALAVSAGRRIGTTPSPGVLSCIGLLTRLSASPKTRTIIDRLWPLIVSVAEGQIIHQRVVAALCYIEPRMPHGESLIDARWSARVRSVGMAGLIAACARGAEYRRGGGVGSWADGIVGALNRSLTEARRIDLSRMATESEGA